MNVAATSFNAEAVASARTIQSEAETQCGGLIDWSIAQAAHVLYCFDVLASHFDGHEPARAPFGSLVACPLFVTWKKSAPLEAHHGGVAQHLQLRGCIGCLKPLPLTSLRDYALNSALHDRRFPPLRASELPDLHCTVQLLDRFEPCASLDWEIGVHGVTINFVDSQGTARSAVYLPDVMPEQGWNHSQVRKRTCWSHPSSRAPA